jgi:hypothetical protein
MRFAHVQPIRKARTGGELRFAAFAIVVLAFVCLKSRASDYGHSFVIMDGLPSRLHG